MASKSALQSSYVAVLGLFVAVLWIFAGWDGRLHWDEPNFLYFGAYRDWQSLTTGPLASSFHAPRLLHIGALNSFFSLLGTGLSSLFALRALCLIIVLGALVLGYLVVLGHITDRRGFTLGYIAGAFAPIVLWLVGRTGPEISGLILTAISIYSLQRFLAHQGRWLWLIIGSLALGGVVLTRNNMVFAVSGYVLALLSFPPSGYERISVLKGAALMCLGGVLSFTALMLLIGITLDHYLGGIVGVLSETAPWASLIYFTGLEGGLVFLALPLAFIFGNRRDAAFVSVWFLLASLPLLILVSDIEDRYLLPNVFALLGLAGVAAAGLQRRIVGWSPVKKLILASAIIMTLFASGLAAQRLMTHEVEMRAVGRVIDRLRETYGPRGGFTLLTPNDVSDFRYLRVAYPDLPVFNVHQEPAWGDSYRRAPRQRLHYGNHFIGSLDELRRLEGPFIYYGFTSNFPVANLRALIKALPIPSDLTAWILAQVSQIARRNQLEESWMWEHPSIRFGAFDRIGHYHFTEIRLSAP